jgi:murein DD-endopeptidase MepM/ murein hydrolase activator NlpD
MQGNGDSWFSSISADGRYVAFNSLAENIVSNDTNGTYDVFVHDRQTGTTTRASVSSSGIQGNLGDFYTYPSISADGHYVVFYSYSSNLVIGDSNSKPDVFVHENDVPIAPFLDLPFQYPNFSEAAQGSNGGGGPGDVNSWFDHEFPNYSKNGYLKLWLGQQIPDPPDIQCIFGNNCYDGHDGIDFRHVSDNVLAAAAGTVFDIGYQPNGFGNYLYIDHHNCYATLYGHLKNPPSYLNGNPIQNGDPIANRQPVGIMGNTGLSIGRGGGVHLHFGLYYDPTCDGNWSDKIVVDPYGY